jgi:hypothetical protein
MNRNLQLLICDEQLETVIEIIDVLIITGNVEIGEGIRGFINRGTKTAKVFAAETREGESIGGDGESN